MIFTSVDDVQVEGCDGDGGVIGQEKSRYDTRSRGDGASEGQTVSSFVCIIGADCVLGGQVDAALVRPDGVR